MSTDRVTKEVGIHSVHGVHGAPITRLRARFGVLTNERKASSTPVAPAPGAQKPPDPPPPAVALDLPPEPPPGLSLLDLPPDLFETWQERACIRHFDGELPWPEAEALALADVLRRGEPVAERTAGPARRIAEGPAAAVQAIPFPLASGPYR